MALSCGFGVGRAGVGGYVLRVGEGERDGNADQLEDTPLGRGGIGDFFDVLSGEVDCFSVEGVEVFE